MKKKLNKKIEATVAGQTIIKSGTGLKTRRQTGVSADRIYNDAAFQGTREAMSDFTITSKAAKALRNSMAAAMAHLKDNSLNTRLTQAMSEVLKADITNAPGFHSILDGNLGLLNDFQFNSKSPLGRHLRSDFTAAIDRVTGEAKLLMPSFVPIDMVQGTRGATHFVVHIAASAVNFENGKADKAVAKTQPIPLGYEATGDITLTAALPANSEHPLFVAVGIYFVKIKGEIVSICRNGDFNEMGIVQVEV